MDLRTYKMEEQEIDLLKALAKEKGWAILLRLLDNIVKQETIELINSEVNGVEKRANIKMCKKIYSLLTNLYREVHSNAGSGDGSNTDTGRESGYPW